MEIPAMNAMRNIAYYLQVIGEDGEPSRGAGRDLSRGKGSFGMEFCKNVQLF